MSWNLLKIVSCVLVTDDSQDGGFLKHIGFKEKADLVRQLNHCTLMSCGMRLADVQRGLTKNNKFFRYNEPEPSMVDSKYSEETLYIMTPGDWVLSWDKTRLDKELEGVEEATKRFILEFVKDGGAKSRVATGTSIDGTLLRTNPSAFDKELKKVPECDFDRLGHYIYYYFSRYMNERKRRELADLECDENNPPEWTGEMARSIMMEQEEVNDEEDNMGNSIMVSKDSTEAETVARKSESIDRSEEGEEEDDDNDSHKDEEQEKISEESSSCEEESSDERNTSIEVDQSSFLCLGPEEYKRIPFKKNCQTTPAMVCDNAMDGNHSCSHALCSRCYKCADERWIQIGGASAKRRRIEGTRRGNKGSSNEKETMSGQTGTNNRREKECDHHSPAGYSPLMDTLWFTKVNWNLKSRKDGNFPRSCYLCRKSLRLEQRKEVGGGVVNK